MQSQSKPARAITSAVNEPGMTHQPPTVIRAGESTSRSSGIGHLGQRSEVETGDPMGGLDFIQRRDLLPAGFDRPETARGKAAARRYVDRCRDLALEHYPATAFAIRGEHRHGRQQSL